MLMLVFLMYLFFGAGFTLLKVTLEYANPLTIVLWRLLIAGSFFLGLYWYRTRKLEKIKQEDFNLFAQFAVIAIFISFVCMSWATQYITSVKSCFYFNLAPFITALIAYVWYGRVLSFRKILGITIGFVGFFPYLLAAAHYIPAAMVFKPMPWLPDFVMLLSVSAYAYGWILLSDLGSRGFSTELVNGIGMLGGGVLTFLFMLLTGQSFGIANPLPIMALIASLALVGNILFYALYSYLLDYYRPTFLSFVGTITPLYAALFGWLFLQEPIPPAFFITVVLVGVGLFVFYYEELF